ncbi:uncharacterized protein LOC121368229 [Gigantopelta aegis]|uniref:uncharacterized protein LOC121368229 n=1 Tax=Gigantopelta aegis TaxID=1735272 RepID=UPI001B88D895|nr:uncharacterized protein LOC121368229 [Gigantopelta aegis]
MVAKYQRLSVQLLKCQMRRRKSTGSALQLNMNGRIADEDMLLSSDNVRKYTIDTEPCYRAVWRNACAAINAILCGCFIAIECASVLVGIVFFHIWFITPYNVICAVLDLKRRCLVTVYNLILNRCVKPVSRITRVAGYILYGKRDDST